MIKNRYQFVPVILLSINVTFSIVRAENSTEDIYQFFGNDRTISIASGYQQSVTDAPGVSYIIDSDDIDSLGATTVEEVLMTVPGMHVSNSRGVQSRPMIRGIRSTNNSSLVVLLNGIPVTRGVNGAFIAFQDILVEKVHRIEIIRGPASTVYGADAFSGVINIVTKTADHIDGTVTGGRAGSFDTYDGWLLHGSRWGDVDLMFSVQGRSSSGQNRTVSQDAQTVLDSVFGTSASLAPGPINTDTDFVDVNIDTHYNNWRFRGNFASTRAGTGTGFINALDPGGDTASDKYLAEIIYSKNISQALKFDAVINYGQNDRDIDISLLPKNTLGIFSDGVLTDLELTERQIYTELTLLYGGLENHTLRTAVGYYFSEIDDITEKRNYLVFPGDVIIPSGQFASTEQLGIPASQPEESRHVYFAMLQDAWKFYRDMTLTLGLRVDYFSEIGDIYSPRAALVWNIDYDTTAKLLYGRAFRPPSFLELSARNNIFGEGNPSLKPETIDMVELNFLHTRPHLDTELTLFWYEIDRRLSSIKSSTSTRATVDNIGQHMGYGVETRLGWEATDHLKFDLNYSYQRSRSDSSTVSRVPAHLIYGKAEWNFRPSWLVNINFKSVIDRRREPDDSRSAVDDYTLVNFFIQKKNLLDRMTIALGLRNLFNSDAREPSSTLLLPNDVPLPGRSVFGEVTLAF